MKTYKQQKDAENLYRSVLTERLSGVTFTLTCFAAVVWAISLLPALGNAKSVVFAAAPLAVLLCCIYLLESILLRRGCRVNIIVIIHVVCMAAGVILYWRTTVFQPAMPGTKILYAVIYAGCMLIALYIAWDPIKPTTIAGCFDCMAILLIIYIALPNFGIKISDTLFPVLCLIAMGLSLIAMIMTRMEITAAEGKEGNAGAGKIITGVMIAIIAAIAVIASTAASGALESFSGGILSLLKTVGSAALAACRWLYNQFYRFMLWISQWLYLGEPGKLPGGEGLDLDLGGDEYEAVQIPLWFYIILAAAAAVVFFLILLKIRKKRVKRTAAAARKGVNAVRSGGPGKAFLAWLKKIRSRIIFNYQCRKNINTPAGMLIWCERRFKKSCPRLASESGSAYLTRLSDEPAFAAAGAELKALSLQVELAFYAPRLALEQNRYGKDQAAGLRKHLKHCARR